tara:strand:- start:188 stop:1126 length:939 start_codon:yes stop_codon:yes gene_type:complete
MATETVRNLPAQFVEDLGKDLATQITAQTGTPVVTGGLGSLTQQTGEDAAQFAARQKAATQFGIRQDSLAGLAPQVAAQDALQTQAQTLATQGVGSFQPYLTAAQNLTGPMTAAQTQQYMSPYQSQVIDATLSEFDRNAAINRQSIRDRAVQSGAFGGGREGVQLAEYDTGSDRNRASVLAQLNQQGFGQAQAQRAADLQTQLGLASLVPGLRSGDISQLGSLGAINQAQSQAVLDAQREATRMATYQPQEQLDRYAGQVAGIMGGYPGQTQTSNVPNPTPLQTALGVGSTLAGIYGSVVNQNPFAGFMNRG